jgi:hypothetical protein
LWRAIIHDRDNYTCYFCRRSGEEGITITIDCEWIEPTAQYWFDDHGHRYWAYERHTFEIVK